MRESEKTFNQILRNSQKKKSLARRLFSFIVLPFILFFFCLFIILSIIPIGTYFHFTGIIQDKNFIMNNQNIGLTLLDRNGTPFFTFFGTKNISYIPLSDIPKSVQYAVITAEDQNFYTNPGFSLEGIFRALFVDVKTGQFREGGSTITQQLAKIAFLNSQKTILRKYQELILAYALYRKYSKQDILEMYLNSVYFGEGAFGIENASQIYFGIHAKDLTLAQASLLISLLPAPSALSPLSNNPEKTEKLQQDLLAEMVQQNYISKQQMEAAEQERLVFQTQKETGLNTLAPHFAILVKNLLTKTYGEEYVIREGLRVQTTLNPDWQTYTQEIVKNQVDRLSKQNVGNGSAVVLDTKTAEIEALVGSKDWNDPIVGKIDMATTSRQPGSSFKPIVYAAALEKHLITPATILHDVPTTFPGNYKPHDYDYKYRGEVTVRQALANSLNIPSVEVMQKVGVKDTISMAERLGISTLNNPTDQYGLSLALGSGEVNLLQLSNAYATFGNNGFYNTPVAILQIQDKFGHILYSYLPQSKQVIGNAVSFLITSILSDNSARKEEFGDLLTIDRPAAVKTGTAENYTNALTIGYTPSLTIGVWVGNNDHSPMKNIPGSLGAAPIWKSLMEHFLSGTVKETFQKPDSVVKALVCPYGAPKDGQSSQIYSEYFLSGTEPKAPSCTPPTLFPSQTVTNTPNSTPKVP